MWIHRLLLVSVLGFVSMGCQERADDTAASLEEDLADLTTVSNALTTAIVEDDVEGIMAHLTDDHVTMPPGGPMLPNNDALRQWHQARVDDYRYSADFVTEDIQVRGDLAIERWSGTSTLSARDGSAEIEDDVKGVWIWERQADGSWKLLWSIWNSNLSQ